VSSFETYRDRFEHAAMRRRGGILEVRLHTNGGPLIWGQNPHEELCEVFRTISTDLENVVMILTGTGDLFSGPRGYESDASKTMHSLSASEWESRHAHALEIIDSLLRIPALVVAAVNGPAYRHCELALMSDIVLCSEDAAFQDSAHYPDNLTPGDGINVVTPMIMGLTRSRYFHLTGQTIHAAQALEWGLVNEVLPRDELLSRAWELATQLRRQRSMVSRHTRLLFTHEIRRKMLDLVGYGVALEGLDVVDARDRAIRNG